MSDSALVFLSRMVPVQSLWRGGLLIAGLTCLTALRGESPSTSSASLPALDYKKEVEPILDRYCFDCHGNGIQKGKVSLDEFSSDSDRLSRHDLWLKVLKNVRAGLMPLEGEPRPTPVELAVVERWIKSSALELNPADPDPGRVTVRRLNRVEYRETIRELMGIDYDSEAEFPADDTGHGFDNLGEVLSSSPLLFEKYLQAATAVVDRAVPRQPTTPRRRVIAARDFKRGPGEGGGDLRAMTGGTATQVISLEEAGEYEVNIEAFIRRSFDFDSARATLLILVDGVERARHDVEWGSAPIRFTSTETWGGGKHELTLRLLPEAPGSATRETYVDVRIGSALVTGPMAKDKWIPTENYRRFFSRASPPESAAEQEIYLRDSLRTFATRAFRRPVDEATVDRLAAIARSVVHEPGKRFEDGFARAAMAVLASPRFVFRIEEPQNDDTHARFPRIDEYALATRLSYFLWSSMPDEELFALAGRGALRENLRAQVERMLKDPKSKGFIRNFAGQWLQARDIETVSINARVILNEAGEREVDAKTAFDGSVRKALRAETEATFEHVIRENRSVLEWVDSDYTFLNAKLAAHYKLPPVDGAELRKVVLPEGSVRGGILTQGSVLAVTSNPTRTSPVKRGLFVLENLMGLPPPPPPPDIPTLEEAKKGHGKELSLRDALTEHQASPLCSSCHARMDPIGFALENFDAMGRWRETESKQPIDASGRLVTGESFTDIRELKRILVTERRLDVYHGMTEKFLMYALGRGLDYRDVETVDQIVTALEANGGKFSELLYGIIESAPFQKMRREAASPSPIASATPPASLTSLLSPRPLTLP
ncbi:MAG TPA: DUF1592 domain-containing protein [Opitutaceae bacterium]|nr:DUF1592 domain-containing protein [Opitutaceae bacterium]